jgi:prepilin-type N-terminal cleavage/methylation domain-containing protein
VSELASRRARADRPVLSPATRQRCKSAPAGPARDVLVPSLVMQPVRARARGYTLIEVLVVVAMVGILAAIAIFSVRRWLAWAKTAETKDLLGAIATGQAWYFDQTNGYLDCSGSIAEANYYPLATKPDDTKHLFHNPSHPHYRCWKLLGVDGDAASYMAFVTLAGNPGQALPALPTEEQLTVPPPADRPWFIVMAIGDQDNDGVMAYFLTSSLQPGDVHIENEAE